MWSYLAVCLSTYLLYESFNLFSYLLYLIKCLPSLYEYISTCKPIYFPVYLLILSTHLSSLSTYLPYLFNDLSISVAIFYKHTLYTLKSTSLLLTRQSSDSETGPRSDVHGTINLTVNQKTWQGKMRPLSKLSISYVAQPSQRRKKCCDWWRARWQRRGEGRKGGERVREKVDCRGIMLEGEVWEERGSNGGKGKKGRIEEERRKWKGW